ncbi:MAG TPA: DUF3048 domain-containing protein [Anaerolineales bacterium]|nr:DUF3048 domain-containing protein [Anaerolineales bacterium]
MSRQTTRLRKFKRLLAFFLLTLAMSICFIVASLALVVVIAEPGVAAQQEQTDTPAASLLTQVPVATETPEPTATLSPTPTPTITPTEIPTQTPTATAAPYVSGPDNFPPNVNPLTGLEVPDPSRLERRPIAIKIVNYPRYVRPQSGLSLADIVYEYYLERGITRFNALFYGNDADKAGPIRSGRFFDEHIFTMYQAIFVFGNADHRVMDHFLELGREVINRFVLEQPEDTKHSCGPDTFYPLCRDRDIVSYNNMFSNTLALSQFISERSTDNSRQNLNGMLFKERPPLFGVPGTSIALDYSIFISNRWLFDAASGRYLRFEETRDDHPALEKEYAPLIDALTNQPVTADNVVVLFVPHEYFVNTPTTEIVKINLIDTGPAILFRDGYAYPGTWTRPQGEGVLSLLNSRGKPLAFRPGITFYEVIGESSTFNQTGGDWQFKFAIP